MSSDEQQGLVDAQLDRQVILEVKAQWYDAGSKYSFTGAPGAAGRGGGGGGGGAPPPFRFAAPSSPSHEHSFLVLHPPPPPPAVHFVVGRASQERQGL
jgi:hypothetical protein